MTSTFLRKFLFLKNTTTNVLQEYHFFYDLKLDNSFPKEFTEMSPKNYPMLVPGFDKINSVLNYE